MGVQLENGYTRIAHELLEALSYRVSNGSWWKLLVYIIRITYGFHKKETETNYTILAQKTNLTESSVIQALWEMQDAHLIFFSPISEKRILISINKDYSTWAI